MRTHTATIEIQAPPARAFAFLADAERLPVWAIGFAKAIAPRRRRLGRHPRQRRAPAAARRRDPATGVVDFVSLPAPGVEAPAHSRVVAHGDGSLYTFCMHQGPDMPDALFDAQAAELERELTVLKAHLETSCPL